jgi:gamma-glutamylcyclotransferase (GGCT)/AIG2-like uncharacterized protein YtfP
MSLERSENLFSYGTLQREEVQLANFNRLLEGTPDALVGYVVGLIPIRNHDVVESTNETHYRDVEFTGEPENLVDGTVFKVTPAELELTDAYESGANYVRTRVQLKSGLDAWVYQHRAD